MLILDEHFHITTDSSRQNFQLEMLTSVEDRKTKEIKQEFKIIGYHGCNFASVLKQYIRESLIEDEQLETIHDVLDKLDELDRKIEKVVKKENFKLVLENDE